MKEQTLALAVVGLIAVSVVAIPAMKYIKEENKKPDYNLMRRYVLSKISDDDLRKIRIEAGIKAKEAAARDEEQYQKQRAEKEKILERCRVDIAFRERNDWDCRTPISWFSPDGGRIIDYTATTDGMYESMIMGVCLYVDTVRQARRAGCLPE